MPSLDLYNKFSCVIQQIDTSNNLLITSSMLYSSLVGYCSRFYFILHDKDINEEGTLKTPHYHLIIDFGKSRKRYTTIINDLSKLLAINQNCISVERCINIVKSVRYLVHKDDLDKYQYSPNLILSNASSFLNIYLNSEDLLSLDFIINAITGSDNYLDLISFIGFENYNRYHYAIDKLWNEIKGIKKINDVLLK